MSSINVPVTKLSFTNYHELRFVMEGFLLEDSIDLSKELDEDNVVKNGKVPSVSFVNLSSLKLSHSSLTLQVLIKCEKYLKTNLVVICLKSPGS